MSIVASGIDLKLNKTIKIGFCFLVMGFIFQYFSVYTIIDFKEKISIFNRFAEKKINNSNQPTPTAYVNNDSFKSFGQEISNNQIDFKSMYLNNPNDNSKHAEIIALKDISTNSMSVINLNRDNSIFNSTFYTSQLFNDLFLGNAEAIEKLGLSNIANYLLVGTINKDCSVSTFDKNTITCTVSMNCKRINLKSHKVVININETQNAIGFSENESTENAVKKILKSENI